MNKLLLLGGGLVLASLTPPAYKTYHNARFGYRIDYPADFSAPARAGKRRWPPLSFA
jgi:hypothetical protein